MTDQSKSDHPEDKDTVTDTRDKPSGIFTPLRVFLGTAVLAAVGASAFLTLGRPDIGADIDLHDAFVRGAVSQIGTDDNARITALHVSLGDAVAKGDPLVELSSARLEAQRRGQRARIAELEALLRETRARHVMTTAKDDTALPAARMNRDAVAARLKQARAEVTLLGQRVARKSELAESGYASTAGVLTETTELDQARSNVDRLEARLGAAQIAIDRARIEAGGDAVRQAERDGISARLARAQADLQALDLRIESRTLTALADGVVVDVPARPGASVGTDDPILSIWDPARTWMLAWVDQDRVGRIRLGDRAVVHIDSVAEPIEGAVRRILVASDGQERTLPGQPVSPLLPDAGRFAVQIGFDARGLADRILPGMAGRVIIQPEGKASPTSPLTDLRSLLVSSLQ